LEIEPEIPQVIEEEPNLSTGLVLRVDVCTFTVYRILHEQGLHPYPRRTGF
jgi:hypothetical protein